VSLLSFAFTPSKCGRGQQAAGGGNDVDYASVLELSRRRIAGAEVRRAVHLLPNGSFAQLLHRIWEILPSRRGAVYNKRENRMRLTHCIPPHTGSTYVGYVEWGEGRRSAPGRAVAGQATELHTWDPLLSRLVPRFSGDGSLMPCLPGCRMKT
jgi:hypothetical protein